MMHIYVNELSSINNANTNIAQCVIDLFDLVEELESKQSKLLHRKLMDIVSNGEVIQKTIRKIIRES